MSGDVSPVNPSAGELVALSQPGEISVSDLRSLVLAERVVEVPRGLFDLMSAIVEQAPGHAEAAREAEQRAAEAEQRARDAERLARVERAARRLVTDRVIRSL